VSRVPVPSDEVLVRLATIATRVEEILAPESPVDKPRVGLQKAKNDRRRTMESVLLLLADREVRDYLAELQRLGLIPTKG
jgi:hypothetical protein